MAFTPLRDFEDSYEIEVDPPHRIRRIGSDRFVSSYVGNTGYAKIQLNGRICQYHRILAKHFLPNPDDLPEVDHVDRNPLNNSIDNLRWISRSENARNRTVTAYGRREYLNVAPNDITEIRTFNGVDYDENKYFFCYENDQVVQRYNDHKWKFISEHPHHGYLRINMRDINGRNHMVYMHKLIHHFRYEPADDVEEEDDIEE